MPSVGATLIFIVAIVILTASLVYGWLGERQSQRAHDAAMAKSDEDFLLANCGYESAHHDRVRP